MNRVGPLVRITSCIAAALLVIVATLATELAPASGASHTPTVGRSIDGDVEPITFEQLAALDELTGAHADVLRLYWAYFDRVPDPSGALFWIDQHDQCVSLRRIAEEFERSAEFRATYGELANGGFVHLLYRNVLDRTADPLGFAYWKELLETEVIDRAELMLLVAAAPEFRNRHPLPSDDVPGRPCVAPTTPSSVSRTYELHGHEPFATVGPVTLLLPSRAVERIGFHESNHDGAGQMQMLTVTPPMMTMETRNRDTVSRGAADIAAHPMFDIVSPVTGTVIRAGGYTLYCHHRDNSAVIEPDDRPGWEVKVLHMQDLAVGVGDRVVAGETLLADRPTVFPFRSQIDEFTAEPSWGHIHIEVVDPSIPDRPSRGGGC